MTTYNSAHNIDTYVSTTDIVVVGAGPYGLSTAAHLLKYGLKVTVLGKPLQLWRENMPEGMLLRSHWWATNFSDPHMQYGLERYFQEIDQDAYDPLPAKILIEYGLWFQSHAVPRVDETYVTAIEREEGAFVLTLADGRIIRSPIVVMAPGLWYYAYRPTEFNHLPVELVSHSSEHKTFNQLVGKSVVIIGRGQSALEMAALAYERGANVQVVTRSSIIWLRDFLESRSLVERLVKPMSGIGPGWFGWQLEHLPYTFHQLPLSVKASILGGFGSYGPAGAAWLKPRVIGKIPLHELQHVQKIRETDNGVVLTLANNKALKADHIILGTGYRVDIKKLPMLHSSINSKIRTYGNAPILNSRFESSISGLYFVGFSSVSSFGPLYRFVLGTRAAARQVASSVIRQVERAK